MLASDITGIKWIEKSILVLTIQIMIFFTNIHTVLKIS